MAPQTRGGVRAAALAHAGDCVHHAVPCLRAVVSSRLRVGAHEGCGRLATAVEAQITGNVFKIEKAVGDTVAAGDVLIVLESMKMEIPVESPCAGRVAELRVEEGQNVEEGTILVVIE